MNRSLCWLLALPALAACSPAADLSCGDDGVWRLKGDGLPAVEGSLFLWHDSYQYETPKDVRRDGQAVTGWLNGSAAGAKVTFRLTSALVDDALELRYVFRRDAATALSRGMLLLVTIPLEPVAKRAVRFTHSEAALVGGGFTGTGQGFDLNLTDQQALSVRLDRVTTFERRGDSPGLVRMNIGLLPADFPAGQDVPVTVRVALAPAGSDRLPWERGMQQPLAIRAARLARAEVPVNTTATVDVDLAGTWTNPFDPDQVTLDAAITFPDGQVRRLPGYYHQEYRAERTEQQEILSPVGEPGWRVRFTPTAPGDYTVALTAKDRSGQVTAPPLRLRATPSTAPGMLRIGQHANVFVREPGGGVFYIGHNVPTYLAGRQSMAEGFDKMAAGGENFTRMWMYSARMGLEWGQPVGTYRLAEAWRLDHAFDLARQRGIDLLLCFDTHQDFLSDRFKQNPYHVDRGGPIRTALEFFSDETARKLYRNRLRYLVARWSHRTNLVAWEFVNEIEGWTGFRENQEVVAAWHSEMAKELRRLDPYAHPISTSCWTTVGWPTLWNAPGLDFIQSHHYSNAKVDMAERTAEICAQKRADYPGRLHLFAEMGIHSKFSKGTGDDEDPTGVHLHNQNWAALLGGAASVPVNWWHESYFEPHNLYGRFRGIANFAAQIDFDRAWTPLDLRTTWVKPPDFPIRRDFEFSGSADSWRPLAGPAVFALGNDGSIGNKANLPDLLHGGGHADLRLPWTFELNMLAAGQFILHVGGASNNPRLVAELDGQVVLDRLFETKEGAGKKSTYQEQWKIWASTYDEDVSIPVPAGRHTLVLRNTGGDWLQIAGYRLPGYLVTDLPPARAMALSDGRELIVWVRNTMHWWLPVSRGETIPTLDAMVVELPQLPAGRYTVEQWDTSAGRVIATTPLQVTGAARLTVPPLQTDTAFRVRPEG